ncbi:MAG TPA: prepilin-type N-terminal cleavage/methylation domain-containing protein [Pyrinomonadaceae bacterium]|nr:prepilin-type N-terminal cleavage/methylation domain-containing protein [Pyrinomonadaceae bacterium]
MTMPCPEKIKGESGFTLVETTIAMVIILVAMLGVAFSLTYAINYNSGNASRAKCLAVLQQEVERMRSAKFTPGFTDPSLAGGSTTRTVTSAGNTFNITTDVDNDPFTLGVQDDSVFTSLKEIRITAQLAAPSPGWQTAVSATFILRRVRSN